MNFNLQKISLFIKKLSCNRHINEASVMRKTMRFLMKTNGIRSANRFAKEQNSIKLDLGCGATKREGFIGVDLEYSADLQWDLRWGIPFANESIVEIRSDHFFEHLDLVDCVMVLRECNRVLVRGGILDISLPHIDPYLDAYIQRDINFLKEKIYDIPQEREWLYNTCFDYIMWLLHRSGEHKSLFDKESIINKIKLAGFDNVSTREFDRKRDLKQRFSSIYIQALK